MKVFLSWSGEKSHKIAMLLDEWLQCTLQSCQPWLSSRSIDRGAIWFAEIMNQLAGTTIGIICLTQDNKDSPWILFESGALAKGLDSNRVCTLLIDLESKDVESPLAQFNHTSYTKDSLQQLLSTINNLSVSPLPQQILEKVFEQYWPDFETKFNAILAMETRIITIKRSQQDILAEILNTIRGLDRRLVAIEEYTSSSSNRTLSPTNGEDMNRVVKRLLNSGKTKDDISSYITMHWCCTESEAQGYIEDALRKNNPVPRPLDSDMLEQLKRKFGKLPAPDQSDQSEQIIK